MAKPLHTSRRGQGAIAFVLVWALGKFFDVEISESEALQWVQQLAMVVSGAWGVWGAVEAKEPIRLRRGRPPIALLLPLLIPLVGCTSLNYAGVSQYDFEPKAVQLSETQAEVGYSLHVTSGREFGEVEGTMTRDDAGRPALSFRATGVKAFEGQRAVAEMLPQLTDTISKAVVEGIKSYFGGGVPSLDGTATPIGMCGPPPDFTMRYAL